MTDLQRKKAAWKRARARKRPQLRFNARMDEYHGDVRMSFCESLSAEKRQMQQRKIPRPALLMQWNSPWTMVFLSANDQGMITMMGLDHGSFMELHQGFKYYYDNYTPYGSPTGAF